MFRSTFAVVQRIRTFFFVYSSPPTKIRGGGGNDVRLRFLLTTLLELFSRFGVLNCCVLWE